MSDTAEPDHATPPAALAPEQLYRATDLSGLAFETTADLSPVDGLRPQARAREALKFGTEIPTRGFNIFAVGSAGARMQEALRPLLEEAVLFRAPPADWVYVHNFATPHRPVALRLAPGKAPALRQTMRHLVEDVRVALPAAFEADEYQSRRGAIEQAFRAKSEQIFSALGERAGAQGLVIVRTPMGFAIAPARDGQVVPPEEFNTWTEEQRRAVQARVQEMEKELEQTLRGIPRLEKERRDGVRALNEETARFAIEPLIEEAKAGFRDWPAVLTHIDAVRADLIENVQLFVGQHPPGEEAMLAAARAKVMERYDVNVLVTQPEGVGCVSVVEELHPTLGNLIGRTEYLSEQGALVTNFTLIKPGALHRANGGIIMIDARALLMEPFSWAALKRALVRGEIQIEDIARFAGLAATVSLEPDPIPLDVKIVLFGDRLLYYLLSAADPEFAQHFKVLADFDDAIDRTAENEAVLAGMLAGIVRARNLPPLDRAAVARVIEFASRHAEDAAKLTMLVEDVQDLIAEAGFLAGKAGRAVVGRADVEAAIVASRRRASRAVERAREMVLRDIALIATSGSAVGQINGLAVFALGGQSFGSVSRITCRVRPGAGRIVDIEREVELGGRLHSKGVLILAGFLAGRYVLDAPMSVSASLVFEQSYGGVDGDSASSTELYALLSALSALPLRQDLAVTGSVNQHGVVQAIGGVNDKIEGFFEICAARGLTGTQGVLIPRANVQHLMLRADVVAACAEGRFHIYPIETIDQGIALLTGVPAGARGADGQFPQGSVNRLVEDRLRAFAKVRRPPEGAAEGGAKEETGAKERETPS